MKADKKLPGIQELSRSIAEVLSDAGAGVRSRPARPSTILSASGGVLLGAALAVAPANRVMAQDTEGEDLLQEEVIVTGSRIPRRDFTANSPITTIDEAVFDETTSIGVETILIQLPQFVPAVTQFTTFDVENTATNTVGASTVSLRGLGPNRNLVLINGRRAMPINPTMVVDTNSIPASAIERVEVISGGASAVYGADAVGGVVNFILKEDFEGASVDVRFGDTQHGGNQEVAISALIGANVADGRGNVLFGAERSTRSKQMLWERDWRVADYANPTTGGSQVFPTETWFSTSWGGPFAFFGGNLPDQDVVNSIFDEAPPCGPPAFGPGWAGSCQNDANGNRMGVRNDAQIYINRTVDGTGSVFAGLNQPTARDGAYRYEGPFNVDNYGEFEGLPFRVVQPDGAIKENSWYQPASIPLDRLSAFGRGVFDVSDSVSVNAQAMFTRTENTTSLGATSDTIGLWGAAIPFGNGIYGPSVVDIGPDGQANTDDWLDGWNSTLGYYDAALDNGVMDPGEFEDMTTLPAYMDGGIYGLDCPDVGGCTKSEAWPVPPEVYDLFISRPYPEEVIWINRTQDNLRHLLGDARGSANHTNTMQLSLGVEGELASGDDFWDVSVSTGRTDTQNILTGSIRLTTYRQILMSPNYGMNWEGDPNPAVVGFAEGQPRCSTGIPVVREFDLADDCLEAIYAPLQNQTSMKQSLIEANIVGDLADMPAGPLGYALGGTYREASFEFTPDNLIRQGSTADAIAGTFPTVISRGEFDVAEIYGELLIPIVSDGPAGVEHFTFELGGRISDWSTPQVDKVETYKALIDWGITPRFRIRGGYNRAMRAPNLGELYVGRSQVFQSLPSVYGDQCSENHFTGPFSANPDVSGAEQAARTMAICRELMGPGGAAEYYDNRPVNGGLGLGTQNTFGNPDVFEEQADTLTLGVVMDLFDNWALTVDYYEIEIEDMIAIQSPDATFESCVSLELNPSGSIDNIFCNALVRNPGNGVASNIDLTFTNQGRAKVSGADVQLNWSTMFANGGLNLNMVANYALKSETQDRPELETYDWTGTRGCSLQIECQGYDYRTFTTVSYFRGPWNITLRHQFWPSIKDSTYATVEVDGGDVDPLGNIDTSYQLVYLGASYSFNDRYTLRFGIENLFDKEPPFVGGDPDNSRFPVDPQRVISLGRGGFGAGGSATYEPLGRRGFVSMTMDF